MATEQAASDPDQTLLDGGDPVRVVRRFLPGGTVIARRVGKPESPTP